MGLIDWLFKGKGHGVAELARRLDIRQEEILALEPHYYEFSIPKRSGGVRQILAPDAKLKAVQQRILRRLLARLAVHSSAMGFEKGRSIVTNARVHQGHAIVLRYDVVNFFGSTSTDRVRRYFRAIGWNRPATNLLLNLCTKLDGLPQGAPTSPRLSNLVNFRLDKRLSAIADRLGGVYTRYADDITVSFSDAIAADITSPSTSWISRLVGKVVEDYGYQLHRRKKQSVRRRHECQIVTGLVVNERVNLPRATRRWLRAVEHSARLAEDRSLASYEPLSNHVRKEPTLTPVQLEGWRAFRDMVERQAIEE